MSKMTFNHKAVLTLLSTFMLSMGNGMAARKPNMFVLFANDSGYADFGFKEHARSDFKNLTPHIDSITKAGLPLEETFRVKRLREIGYKTGLIGKWCLGYPEAYHPNRRGYDEFFGLLQGSRSYYPLKKITKDRVNQNNGTPTEEYGYVTDRLGQAACEFIEANKDHPFYLFVSFTAPNGPLEPRKSSYDAQRIGHIEHDARRNYAGLVVAMDGNVGKILATIENFGLNDDTIVVFTNDNGGPGGKDSTSNYPFRGHKGPLYEGGIRVPWAMAWPGVIEPGTVINSPVITMDLLPTLFQAAGESIEESWRLDGQSLMPLFGASKGAFQKRMLYWRRHGIEGPIALRQVKWKLLDRRTPDGSPKLYDFSIDVGEKNNLPAEHPKILAHLRPHLDDWQSGIVAPIWGPGSAGYRDPKQKDR